MYFFELKGQVAVVLGGRDSAGGVSAAVCRLLAERGARIAVVGPDESELVDLVDELRWGGTEALGIVAEGTDAATMDAVRTSVLAELGAPDLLFVLPCPDRAAGWQRTVDSGLTAVFQALQAFVPCMAEAKTGAVVTLAPRGPDPATNAVGGGVTALTQHYAWLVADSGVRANVVSWTPGGSTVDEAAFAALYLASDASATMTATTLDVAGTLMRL